MTYHLAIDDYSDRAVCWKPMEKITEDGDTVRDDFKDVERPMEMCEDCLAMDLDRQVLEQIVELKEHEMTPRGLLLHPHGVYAARRHLSNVMRHQISITEASGPHGFKGFRWRDLLVIERPEAKIWEAEVWGRPRREGESA